MEKDIKLDFVGIGVPKSGTSWIYQCLQEHPEACCSIPKELHFFNKNHGFHKPNAKWRYRHKGWEWYKKHFKHCKQGQIIGEVDPLYIYEKQSLELIKENFPNIKVIISLRNPIERAFSFYFHLKSKKKYRGLFSSFEEALKKEPEFKEWGLYSRYVKNCYEIFPEQNILVLIYDNLKKDPLNFIQKIYGFLGIQKNFVPPCLDYKVNVGVVRMSPLSKVIQKAHNFLKRFRLGRNLWKFLKKIGFRKKYLDKLIIRVKSPPTMKKDTRAKLENFYKKDVEKTEELVGKSLRCWKSKN